MAEAESFSTAATDTALHEIYTMWLADWRQLEVYLTATPSPTPRLITAALYAEPRLWALRTLLPLRLDRADDAWQHHRHWKIHLAGAHVWIRGPRTSTDAHAGTGGHFHLVPDGQQWTESGMLDFSLWM